MPRYTIPYRMLRERFGLWDPDAGLGMPVSLSDSVPPFHPLALLGNELAITIVCATLAAWFCYFSLRRVPAAVLIAVFVLVRPDLALLTLGASSLVASIDWFADDPTRRRWLAVVLAATLAILGTRGNALTALAALAFAAAWTAGSSDLRPSTGGTGLPTDRRLNPTVAGVLSAAATATLLALPWILAGHAIRPEELPVEVQYTTEWPLAICAAIPFAMSRYRARWSAGATAIIVVAAGTLVTGLVVGSAGTIVLSLITIASAPVAVLAVAVAAAAMAPPPPDCGDCLSRRTVRVLQEKRWDVAAIRALPDFSFAPLVDGESVDHLPPKLAGRGAPERGIGAGGSLVVESRTGDEVRLRIRSNGWNVVVTNIPAWSGWRAYWNGERIPPVVANGAFVGSYVPPGDGVLVLRYRPDQFDTGVRVALGGLLLAFITLVKPWYLRVRIPRIRIRLPRVVFRAWYLLVPLLVYLAVLLMNFAAIAGGADSSGYLNHSRLWNRGTLAVPIALPQQLGLPPELDRLFIPLGFVRGRAPYTMVPSYPPGLPLMMAGARLIGGDAAAFRIVAVMAALGVLLMYFLGRTLGLSTAWAAAGATILAVHPTFVFMSVQPMSDSVATTLALAAMIGALRARQSLWWAVFAGAMMGVGVLVRPTQVLLFPAVVLALRLRPRALLALAAGGLPFAVAQVAISQHLYGSPLATGYGGVGYLTTADGALTRLRHYSYWLAILGTPVMFPGGLAAWGPRIFDGWTRVALAAWFTPFFVFYVFYPPYETWWYTRFLLPALPALIAGALAMAARWRIAGPMLAALVIITGIIHVVSFDILAFDTGETIYTRAVSGAQRRLPDDAMLVAMQTSGALRYYAGRTIVRGDGLTPETFRIMRGAAGSRPWFALVAEFEKDDTFRNAPGEWVEVEAYGDVALYRLKTNR